MFEDLGPVKLLLILLVILVLFGAKKIPDVAKGIGKGIRDFKKALKEDDEEIPPDKDKKLDK
jgi:sec-independent protein translocase protein TatA